MDNIIWQIVYYCHLKNYLLELKKNQKSYVQSEYCQSRTRKRLAKVMIFVFINNKIENYLKKNLFNYQELLL